MTNISFKIQIENTKDMVNVGNNINTNKSTKKPKSVIIIVI